MVHTHAQTGVWRERRYSGVDLRITHKKQKTCKPIDVAISGDRNVVQNDAKEIRYKRLWIEIKLMCNQRHKIIPVTIRVTIIVTEVWKKNLEVVQGKYSIDSIWEIVMLGIYHT